MPSPFPRITQGQVSRYKDAQYQKRVNRILDTLLVIVAIALFFWSFYQYLNS